MLRRLARFTFGGGYNSSPSRFDQPRDQMAYGSQNVLIDGDGGTSVFQGTEVINAKDGSKVLMNVGEDFGGLGSYADSEGVGSIFRVLGAWFFIGAGSLFKNGVDTSADASTTLQIKKVESGTLGTTYQAGLAQPSAPTIRAITAPTGFSGKNNGIVSVKTARVRGATGARSNASLSSNVVTATNQSIAVTFPSADANGQDYWEVDVTKNGEGAIGNHFFLQEIPESVIAETITASTTTDADTTVTVPNDTLTSEHIGWQYTSSGDTTTYVTAVGADDSGGAGSQLITLAAASVLTTTQNATFTRAIDGVTRTYVFEWQDSDIIGSDLAPIRDYPPPAGIFGGALGDVVFVDGALGDTVDVTQYAIDSGGTRANTTTTYRGNAIAVSDPSRPESFPPDNYVFTNDPPTALLPGSQGMFWRFARNSLGVIRYVGGSPALTYERLWSGVGVSKQAHCTLGAGGRLYAYTGQKGLVRLGMNGEPDTSFATPVHKELSEFTAANVWMGYDPAGQYILIGEGVDILAFHEPSGRWCAPLFPSITLGGSVVGCVSHEGRAILSISDGSSQYTTEYFNSGAGGPTIKAVTPWVRSEGASDVLSRIDVAMNTTDYASSNSANVKVYRNGLTTSAAAFHTATISQNGGSHLPTLRPNVRGCKSWCVEVSYGVPSSEDAGFDEVIVEGETSGIIV